MKLYNKTKAVNRFHNRMIVLLSMLAIALVGVLVSTSCSNSSSDIPNHKYLEKDELVPIGDTAKYQLKEIPKLIGDVTITYSSKLQSDTNIPDDGKVHIIYRSSNGWQVIKGKVIHVNGTSYITHVIWVEDISKDGNGHITQLGGTH